MDTSNALKQAALLLLLFQRRRHMTVWIVTLAIDNGMIVGVFTTEEKACDYITKHPYNAYTLSQHIVDEGM